VQLSLQRNIDVPIYRQIVNQVREQIRIGTLRDGSRLPPVRQLAAECGLTRLTVHSAYAELQAEGLVESHVGRGTYVTAGAPAVPPIERPAQPAPWISQGILANLLGRGELGDLLSFAQAFPAPETYPARELGRALQAALTEQGVLGYGHIQGEPELREEVATLLLERGMSVSPDHMLITSGAQQGIDLALRALTQPGDVILVEDPVYPGVLELAALRGQRVVGIPNDGGELRIDALEAACSAYAPRLLYLVPTYSNPTGKSLTRECREAVLRTASAHNLWILEDDTYGLLGFDRSTPPALQSMGRSERVVYITSFSKMLTPALRLGALVAPVSVLPALAAAKQSSDLVCSALMQRALAHYLRQGRMAMHLQGVRELYVQRRDAMLQALQRHLPRCTWTDPEGGLSLWVDLPPGIIERDFTADALRQGIGIAPGAVFFAKPQFRGSMRLSFGVQAPERIEEGVAALGRVLETHLQRRDSMTSLAGGAAGPLV
jgi:DNA-binding transcriptional MocR family regulator